MLVWMALVLGLVFWVAAIVDVVAIDELDVRGLSKAGWVLLVLLVPIAGAVVWVRRGRGSWRPFPARGPLRSLPGDVRR